MFKKKYRKKIINKRGNKKNLRGFFRFLGYNLLFFLMGTAVYQGYEYFTLSPYFSLKEVALKGDNLVNQSELMDLVERWKNKNIFKINAGAIGGCLKNNSLVEKISIEKYYPDRIEVTVKEREPAAILALKKSYLIDRTGFVLAELSEKEAAKMAADLPVIRGIADEEIFTPDEIMPLLAEEADEEVSAFIFQFIPWTGNMYGYYEKAKNYWNGTAENKDLSCTEMSLLPDTFATGSGLAGKRISVRKLFLGMEIIDFLNGKNYSLKSTRVEYLTYKNSEEIVFTLRQIRPQFLVGSNYVEDFSLLPEFTSLINREEKNIEYVDLRFKNKVIIKSSFQGGGKSWLKKRKS